MNEIYNIKNNIVKKWKSNFPKYIDSYNKFGINQKNEAHKTLFDHPILKNKKNK